MSTTRLIIIAALIAQSFSRQSKLFPGVDHEHGFIEVKEQADIFFWFFRSASKPSTDPVVLWLTGGPGCSSELALFVENGPFTINDNLEVVPNPYSWHNYTNLLFVDQPFGTGYSRSTSSDYVTTEDQVAENMSIFLNKWVNKFPEFKGRDFYITGESYAGHYIPAIGAYLLDDSHVFTSMTLKGLAIGNGMTSPKWQYPEYAEYSYDNGLIDSQMYNYLKETFNVCKDLIEAKKFEVAEYICGEASQWITGDPSRFNYYDIRLPCSIPGLCYDFSNMENFFKKQEVRQELGVQTRRWESCTDAVHAALQPDWFLSVEEKVKQILEHKTKPTLLIYYGDQDYICNWYGGRKWTHELVWASQEGFKKAPMKDWTLNGKHLGEFKLFDNLVFLRVFDAGHMVPLDQPEAALKMLDQLIGRNGVTK